MATIPALYVLPDGTCERIELTGDGDLQTAQLADMVEGPLQHWPLGRHLVAHTSTPPYPRGLNQLMRATWCTLAGDSPAPDLRGPIVVTGPADRDGTLQPLPLPTTQLFERFAALLHGAKIRRRPDISAAQLQGTRDLQCDAHAVHRDRDSGRWAFVVLDGIGDEDYIQEHVRAWAPALARAAARLGDPAEAIAHVRAQILASLGHRWGHLDAGAVAVVAVHHPRDPLLRVAWSGDARAYRLSPIGGLELLTKDHNWAQALRDAGRTPKKWDHNSVLAHLESGEIGAAQVEVDVVAQLILCSDGVYHPLETYEAGLMEVAAVLALDAKDSAASLVAEGVSLAMTREGRADNATSLVVAFPHPF